MSDGETVDPMDSADEAAAAPEERLEPEPAGPDEARAFLQAVRRAAGWRVSPRQVEAAIEATTAMGETVTPERIAEVASAMRGERSQRQRRHAERWRALGADLAVRGMPSDPEAQREFLGIAKAIAGDRAGDEFLLAVAMGVAAAGAPLEPRVVGQVARWLLRHGHAEGTRSDEELAEAVPQALASITAEQRRRRRARVASAPRAPAARTRRRAKPAGRARQPRKRR